MSGTLAVTEVLFVADVFVFAAALTAMNGGYFPTSWPLPSAVPVATTVDCAYALATRLFPGQAEKRPARGLPAEHADRLVERA